MDILIFILGFILIAVIFTPRKTRESFKIKRKRPSGKIKVGTLNNTPGPMKGMMADLNKTGGQVKADSEYDTVATDYIK
tara:strand:- start:2764 stop:3000 length:237 start_codon:yes stop_codon:yes gene_type:complete